MDATDKKLVEDAARAAGWPIELWRDDPAGVPVAYYLDARGGHTAFQPLYENKCSDCMGDALRLAVKLGMEVYVDTHPDGCECTEAQSHTFKNPPCRSIVNHDGDPYAATRRAIVVVAASLAKERMEG